MKNKTYTCYKVLLKCPCCEKQIEIYSGDYYWHTIKRRNQLIETFGNKRISMVKKVKKLII